MKLIFLDIDGVLNARKDICEDSALIAPEKLAMVVELVKEFDAKIILTSSHRLDKSEPWRDEFLRQGVSVFGMTPVFRGDNRHKEILAFLADHDGEVEAYAIIDDRSRRWGKLKKRVVHTRANRGILREDIEKARKLLAVKK